MSLLSNITNSVGTGAMCTKESSYGITGVPALFYRLNFSNNRDYALNVASDDELEVVLKYIDDPSIRVSVYRRLKNRAFKGKYFNSKILNEVVSMVDFARSIFKYGSFHMKERQEAKRL